MSNDRDKRGVETDSLGRLIRRAGQREAIPELVERRVRQNVEKAWLDATSASNRTHDEHQKRHLTRWAFAATLLVAFGVVLFTSNTGFDTPTSGRFGNVAVWQGVPRVNTAPVAGASSAIEIGDRVTTNDSARLSVAMDNGASVRIDNNTEIRFVSATTLDLVTGAVYVDSGPDSEDSPGLTVSTAFGDAIELGTQFEVRVDARQLGVKVREGKVDMVYAGHRHTAQAGENVRLAASGTIGTRAIAADGDDWAWVEEIAPDFNVDGASLYKFLRWAARETGRELAFENEAARMAVRRITLTGDTRGWRPEESIAPVITTTTLRRKISVSADRIYVAE